MKLIPPHKQFENSLCKFSNIRRDYFGQHTYVHLRSISVGLVNNTPGEGISQGGNRNETLQASPWSCTREVTLTRKLLKKYLCYFLSTRQGYPQKLKAKTLQRGRIEKGTV